VRPEARFLNGNFVWANWDVSMLEPWGKRANMAVDDFGIPKSSDLVFNAKSLAMKLIQESVYFGEVPRFFKRNIDDAASSFLGNVIIDSSLALPISVV
jgi:NADPH-dependent 7-cyano-7-deazaguanine reductase QueF-like protein